jgi:hypothetical protein
MEKEKRIEQENHFRKISFEFPGLDQIVDLVKLVLLRLDDITADIQHLLNKVSEQKASESETKVDEIPMKDE